MRLMPVAPGGPTCSGVLASAPSELAWVLNLLVQTARYGPPAIAELEHSLLPGIAAMQASVRQRYGELWDDGLAGCPELTLVAHHAGCLLDADPARFIQWIARSTNRPAPIYELLAEPADARNAINARLERLCKQGQVRIRYADLLRDLWSALRGPWERDGPRIVLEAASSWTKRIERGGQLEDLVAPRHPLTRADELEWVELFAQRPTYVVSPLYFCLSGGHVIDVGEYVHVAVAASDLLPIRRERDAMFVADRLRVLSESTRVRVLIQLMSAPSGVMDLARVLRVSQPTVSAHVKVLRQAGLIQQKKMGSRAVFVASRRRIERLLEDARATLVRWD